MPTHKIFTPFEINHLKLKNRFVRSATFDNMAEDDMVTDREVELYRNLGRGDIGLIITHGIFPSKNGKAAEGQIGAHTDATIPSLKKLADAVHENGGKIAAQILHGGSFCREEISGSPGLGPSNTISPRTGRAVKEMSEDEIHALIEDYGQAARRLIEAEYDAIQLHGAHQWLLSAFLSPATNQRNDQWGGSAENRLRLVRKIYERIREIAGPDYPVFIKLGLKDYHPDGKSLSEGLHSAKILEEIGMDAIEVSEGIESEPSHHIRKDAVHPYYLDECRAARRELSLPLILVGGMRYVKDMQAVLDENIADAVSMCRPFINDPAIVQKFEQGITDHSGCISCKKCTDAMQTRNLRCVLTEP